MKILFTFAFCLLTSSIYAGQTFTIPQGTTVYGPVTVNPSINKYANFDIDRSLWTNPNIKMTAVIEVSLDGTTWATLCTFKAEGSAQAITNITGDPVPTQQNCPFPPKGQQIKATVTVVGGSIAMSRPPSAGGKP